LNVVPAGMTSVTAPAGPALLTTIVYVIGTRWCVSKNADLTVGVKPLI
jgi:hypothetical protein